MIEINVVMSIKVTAVHTGYGGINVEHGFFLTQKGGAFVDDAQRRIFRDSTFHYEMLLKYFWLWFSFSIEDLTDS